MIPDVNLLSNLVFEVNRQKEHHLPRSIHVKRSIRWRFPKEHDVSSFESLIVYHSYIIDPKWKN
jgi:hypothetical protein